MDTKPIENQIRDIINWVAVFKTEYDLPEEVVNELKQKLEKVAYDIGHLE